MGIREGAALPSVIAAAHELKAPLVLLRQLAFAVLADEGMSQAARQRLTERMILTSDRALRLTTDLTKSVRLEDALFELEPLNVRELSEDVIREMSPLFTAHERQLVVRRQRSVPLVVGQRDLLRRVLANFMDNALHYGDSSGKIEVLIRAKSAQGVVRIGVRDYGPAVPTTLWRSIEDAMQAPVAFHARPQSSGLGLYIAKQFAEAMQASVGAIRHRDGATFYIDLPISKQLSLV